MIRRIPARDRYMHILYDIIFLIIAIVYLPIYLFRGKFHRGFFSRLGILPKDLELNRPIWVHAVSVGEAMAAKGLIEGLRKTFPNKRLVISTVTPTGNKIVQGFKRENDLLIYLPLDFSFITRRVIEKINPSLVIIVETELWPNLILNLSKKDIPVLLVNGRISDRSFQGYLRVKFLFKPVLDKISLFCVQSGRDAERLMRLGVSEEKIRITGNMKFDIKDSSASSQAGIPDAGLKQSLGVAPEEKIFVAGSTHPGEEEIILDVYKNLLSRFDRLKLLLAPRHPERAANVERLVVKYGFQPLRISRLNAGNTAVSNTVFVLDTIGQLQSFYRIADIVFVGGSLVKKGGHNILEPAFLAKPIISGRYMFNFRDIADLFVNNAACILVNNARELEAAVVNLLDNPAAGKELGVKAKELIAQNQEATLENLEQIKKWLKN
jgi:3-deoxy-D-manno-octulosonic-acid transferase